MKVSKILLFAFVLILATSLVYTALADTYTDTATVYVSVQAVTQISVEPDVLQWTNVPVGSAGGTQSLNVKNIGSKNVSQIHAYVDTLEDEASRPYGSSNATDYAAGGVIVFRNETYNKYFFAGRIEWNWTEDISNMIKSGVSSPVAWGFFKNTSYEYNWLVGNGTDGFCNNTATQFAVEDDVDNGTAATREPSSSGIQCNQADENYTYCRVTRSSAPLYESCVAVYKDCSKIYIYKYDKRGGFGSCGNAAYIQEGNLVPYQTHTIMLDVYMPLGVPSGDLSTATFTVYASSN